MIRFRKFFEMIFLLRKVAFLSKNQAKSVEFKFGVKLRLFCLKDSFWNDRKNDSHSDMTRGKSPCFRNEGAGLVMGERELFRRESGIIIPKRQPIVISKRDINLREIWFFRIWKPSFFIPNWAVIYHSKMNVMKKMGSRRFEKVQSFRNGSRPRLSIGTGRLWTAERVWFFLKRELRISTQNA